MIVRNGQRLGSILLHDRRVGSSPAGAEPKAPAKAETKAKKDTAATEKPKQEPKAPAKADAKKEG